MNDRDNLLRDIVDLCFSSSISNRPEKLLQFISENKMNKATKHELRQYAYCLAQLPKSGIKRKLGYLNTAYKNRTFLSSINNLYNSSECLRKMFYNVDSGKKCEIFIALLLGGIPVGGLGKEYEVVVPMPFPKKDTVIADPLSIKYTTCDRLILTLYRTTTALTESYPENILEEVIDRGFSVPLLLFARNSRANLYRLSFLQNCNYNSLKEYFDIVADCTNKKSNTIRLVDKVTGCDRVFMRINNNQVTLRLDLTLYTSLQEKGFIEDLTLSIDKKEKEKFKELYLLNYVKSLLG